MIKIDELKEAISTFDDISDMDIVKDGVSFKYQGVLTIASTYEGDKVSSNKLCVMNSFKSPSNLPDKNVGEKIAEMVNLKSKFPAKVVYVHISDDSGAFVCKNIFSDKLNALGDKDGERRDLFLSNLKVVILGMMLENYSSFYDIKNEMAMLVGEGGNENK
ncbi:hypothetical protein SE915_12705 [Klebsiella pneumoniae]|uniref:hypothetical protein n=1 Tax=Klebsiella pneumoniae complex TaxID=3390273 RepID=UPI0022EC21E6|nr:hypothetical protein [Klebsiella quasipneumoniae]MDW8794240.1 hypothetical protein [Klebsiella pneumoniae]HBR0964228.1 hypothetical protein [Klebsiella quasipneumoniae subsp. similipneumoniae]MDA4071234.1 hypothetical protein [Klebsiella quasipneumoniae]HCM6690164.1 hypothetical protein [Klebsiella pneumoniae]HDT0308700.1 hypothetical protein [Klebsiella quasipneumoniae subsp. similipneumoniae]